MERQGQQLSPLSPTKIELPGEQEKDQPVTETTTFSNVSQVNALTLQALVSYFHSQVACFRAGKLRLFYDILNILNFSKSPIRGAFRRKSRVLAAGIRTKNIHVSGGGCRIFYVGQNFRDSIQLRTNFHIIPTSGHHSNHQCL